MESKAPLVKGSCFRRAGCLGVGITVPLDRSENEGSKRLCCSVCVIFFRYYFILLFTCLLFVFEGVMVVCVLRGCLYTLAFACIYGGHSPPYVFETGSLSDVEACHFV